MVTLGSGDYFGDISFQALTLAASATLNVAGSEAFLEGGTLVNDGSIGVTGTSGYLAIVAPTLTNNGIINVGSGDQLLIEGEYNNGYYYYYATQIIYGGSGAIDLAPGSVLTLSGYETTGQILALAGSIIGSQTGVTVEFGFYIENTGSSLDFEPGGSLGSVILAADITGGSIINASGSVTVAGGTLNGVAYQGVLDLGPNAYLSIANGLTLNAIGGGLGTLDALGTSDTSNTLLLQGGGTQALGNLLIEGSGGLNVEAQGVLNSNYVLANPGTLAIGGNVTSDLAGALELTGNGAGTVVNAGTLLALTAGSGIAFSAAEIVNTGTIMVSAGAFLGFAGPGQFTLANSGDIAIASGATLALGGSFTPESFSAEVGSLVSAPGVTVEFGGVTNRSNVLTVGGTFIIPPTGPLSSFIFDDAQVLGGSAGGTVVGAGTVSFAGDDEFDNLTYVGSITSTAPDTYLSLGGTVALLSGTAGPETISLLGTESGLEFSATNLDGTGAVVSQAEIDNAVINFGAPAATLDGYQYGDQLEVYGGTLTFGATTTVEAQSGFTVYVEEANQTGALVNKGTIVATGGSVTIETYSGSDVAGTGSTPVNQVGVFVNDGLFIAGPGTTALPAGSVALTMTGSVVNAGTIAVSGADSFVVNSTSFSNTGLVALSGGATLDFATAPTAAGTILLADGAETVRVDSPGAVHRDPARLHCRRHHRPDLPRLRCRYPGLRQQRARRGRGQRHGGGDQPAQLRLCGQRLRAGPGRCRHRHGDHHDADHDDGALLPRRHPHPHHRGRGRRGGSRRSAPRC